MFDRLLPYVGYVVDDSGNGRRIGSDQHANINDNTVLVGYQCGFEPMVVAVNSFMDGITLDDSDAEDLAKEYLLEIGWLQDSDRDADYIVSR
jgi:hypothetical protein